MNSYNNLN